MGGHLKKYGVLIILNNFLKKLEVEEIDILLFKLRI
jgi:hypothetical protein